MDTEKEKRKRKKSEEKRRKGKKQTVKVASRSMDSIKTRREGFSVSAQGGMERRMKAMKGIAREAKEEKEGKGTEEEEQ